PWTLEARSADGYSGEITAMVQPCDGVPDPVLVDRNRPAVAVVLLGPVDASCGKAKPTSVPLHAATVASQLPPVIAHDPLGPYLGPSEW
ncbi:MAG: hypothetical protein ACRDYC_07195, partial [Acidimicrobiales bacterium]